MTVRSIAILFHARQTDAHRMHYRIWPIAENWRRWGLDVRVVFGVRGNERALLSADLLIPHVDYSVRSPEDQALMDRHPLVMNRGCRDIRKRAVSTRLLTREDASRGVWPGPVIVKTDGNCGGLPDYHYERAGGPSTAAKLRRRVCNHPRLERRLYPWAHTLSTYPILASARHVPRAVWRNPRLVVERFTPERRLSKDGKPEYVMRLWMLTGDAGLGRIIAADNPLVKARHGTLEYFHEPPPVVLEWARRFGVDYGKVDYVCPGPEDGGDGTPVLLDISLTPTVSGDAFSEFYVEQCAGLAQAGVEWAEAHRGACGPHPASGRATVATYFSASPLTR